MDLRITRIRATIVFPTLFTLLTGFPKYAIKADKRMWFLLKMSFINLAVRKKETWEIFINDWRQLIFPWIIQKLEGQNGNKEEFIINKSIWEVNIDTNRSKRIISI